MITKTTAHTVSDIFDTFQMDWNALEKKGYFTIQAPDNLKHFLQEMHNHYLQKKVTVDQCSGRNKLNISDDNQIIRLFILNHYDNHPFNQGFEFENINLLMKTKLAELWKLICDHYHIKHLLDDGEDSTGIHHYPGYKSSKTGLKGHIDSTLLVGNLPTGPGLEVYYDNEWHDVYLKDHIVVNVGFLGSLLSGLPPCIHRVRSVNIDRSVIVFSPGFNGMIENMSVKYLIRAFFECFDELEITNERDVTTFKEMIFKYQSKFSR